MCCFSIKHLNSLLMFRGTVTILFMRQTNKIGEDREGDGEAGGSTLFKIYFLVLLI